MTLIVVGINHQTAPVQVRERCYLSNGSLNAALETLKREPLSEVVILSTCNRLEIFAAAEEAHAGFEAIASFLAGFEDIPDIRSLLIFQRGDAAAERLMRVASGLESLILGETQILGQVSNALTLAQAAHTIGPLLSRLFTSALHAGKRVHNETEISRHTLSVSHAGALLVEKQLGDLKAAHVVVVGAGEMGKLAASAFQMHGASSITISNRTYSRAQELAERMGVQAVAWEQICSALEQADAVIMAAATPRPILSASDLSPLLHERPGRPLLVVDIGVPRNVAEDVAALPGVRYWNIDDLCAVVDDHRDRRLAEVAQAKTIIASELAQYVAWLHSREVAPLISELQRKAEAVANAEVEQTLRRLPDLDAHDQELVAQLAHRIVGKLLHAPIVTLKSESLQGSCDYADTVRRLFALDEANHPHSL